MLYTDLRFGWGPAENGWSLFAVGIMSALVQGLLLGRLLKRFSPQQAGAGRAWCRRRWPSRCGRWRPQGWMMYVVIFANVLGFTVTASIQSIISGAADAPSRARPWVR